MNTGEFISLIAMLTGFIGSCLFCFGTIRTSKSELKDIGTKVFLGQGIIATNLAVQRVDFIYGVFLISFAFCIELIWTLIENHFGIISASSFTLTNDGIANFVGKLIIFSYLMSIYILSWLLCREKILSEYSKFFAENN